MNDSYLNTVRLLLQIAPYVFDAPHFAMKGGTALNLFLHDLPRLSVDIDVTFTDHQLARTAALEAINSNLAAAKASIEKLGHRVQFRAIAGGEKIKGDEVKLTVISGDASVKVEVNYVFRGSLLKPVMRTLAPAAQERFETSVAVPTLADAELYGSKLVAALDRQHPRDIFDVMHMYQAGGLRQDIVDAFVAYLAGHNRPVHEVLFATPKSIAGVFEKDFVGMTSTAVDLEQLLDVQAKLHRELPAALTAANQEFLISLVRAEPDWSLMPYEHMAELPAIRWKLENLTKLRATDSKRFAEQATLLQRGFDTAVS